MNPIRRRMIALATEAARDVIGSVKRDSLCAIEVSKLDDLEETISDEVTRLCRAATLGEMSKTFLLVRQIKKALGHEKATITNELRGIAEKLTERVESESGPLKLPEVCLHLFSEL